MFIISWKKCFLPFLPIIWVILKDLCILLCVPPLMYFRKRGGRSSAPSCAQQAFLAEIYQENMQIDTSVGWILACCPSLRYVPVRYVGTHSCWTSACVCHTEQLTEEVQCVIFVSSFKHWQTDDQTWFFTLSVLPLQSACWDDDDGTQFSAQTETLKLMQRLTDIKMEPFLMFTLTSRAPCHSGAGKAQLKERK